MMTLWRKTAEQVKNIPSNTSKQEITIRFEGRSNLEIELHIKQAVQGESNEETTVISNSETSMYEKLLHVLGAY